MDPKIQLTEERVKQLIREAIATQATTNQFGMTTTSYHIHNGLDAPKIKLTDLNTINIPTSATGLKPGDIYISSGTLKIVT